MRARIRGRASWRLAAAELATVALRDPRWSAIAIQAEGARAIADDLVATLERVPLDLDASLAARAAIAQLLDDDLDRTVESLAASARPAVRRIAVFALEHAARPGRGCGRRASTTPASPPDQTSPHGCVSRV